MDHDHQWPAVLDATAKCEVEGCGVVYGEWEQADFWQVTYRFEHTVRVPKSLYVHDDGTPYTEREVTTFEEMHAVESVLSADADIEVEVVDAPV